MSARLYIAYVMVIWCLLVAVAAAQTTQPVTPPQATTLRDIAGDFERLDGELRFRTEQLLQEQVESAKLRAEILRLGEELGNTIPYWNPTTVLEEGKSYRLPSPALGLPVKVAVSVKNVKLYGGNVCPVPNGPMCAITAMVGGDNLLVVGTRFSWDEAPDVAGKYPLKPCVRTYAKNTRLLDLAFGKVSAGIECMAPCDGVVINNCTFDNGLRGGGIYVGGGRNVAIDRLTIIDSATENTVRCSPENGVVPENFSIRNSTVRNPGNKAAVELRSVTNAVVENCDLEVSQGHSCVGVGRKTLLDGPGATNVVVRGNRCVGGQVNTDAGSDTVLIENNEFRGIKNNDPDPRRNEHAITADGRAGTLKNLVVRNNVAVGTGSNRPVFGPLSPENIPGLVAENNRWEVR